MTPEKHDDAGVMMIELVVVMTVLSIITAMATAGLVGMFREYRSALAYTEAQTQAGRALQRLDTEVRYAGDLEAYAGDTARAELPDPSLVWITATDPQNTGTPVVRCFALSMVGDALQRREWAANPAAGVVAQAMPITLVKGVQTVDGQQPFKVSNGHHPGTSDTGEVVDVQGAERADVSLQVVQGDSANPVRRVLFQHLVAPNTFEDTYAVSADQCF